MKNIVKVALLLLLVAGTASCNLDKYPSNALLESEGFLTYKDAKQFRNGIYYYARNAYSTAISVNIQGEGINATRDYGNQGGFQYNWNFMNNDADVEGVWGNSYIALFQFNYFIKNAELIRDEDGEKPANEQMKPAERALLDLYIGEAYFFRAMVNYQLTQYYCKDYDPATAATDMGIIITKDADINARLQRSSLEDTFLAINSDIKIAETAILNYYVTDDAKEYYVGKNTINALKAKVALDMHDYTTAATLATDLVSKYSLSSKNSFPSIWKSDTGSEIIYHFYASLAEGGYANYGGLFLFDPDNTGFNLNPRYLPTQWFLDQYDANDIRKSTYFENRQMKIGTSYYYDLYAIIKYPGNPAYNTSATVNVLSHNVMPYRSADFCLIAAEAYYMDGNVSAAQTQLEALLKARTGNSDYKLPEGTDVWAAIKLERLKEMFMEGNRIADLKRWGDKMSRVGQDPQNMDVINNPDGPSTFLEVLPTDKRFVWPIPQSEMNANPALKGQQNEGW